MKSKHELEVRDLTFRKKSLTLLDNITFKLNGPENLVLLGLNGSGKTTLIKCLLELTKISSGNIFYNKKKLSEYSVTNKAQFFSYVPQIFVPTFGFSVIEFLNISKNLNIDAINNSIRQCKLEHLTDKKITELSGGELRKVLIASALSVAPKILYLDEPFAGLDPKATKEVLQILLILKAEQRCSIVIALHDLNISKQIADKVLALKRGKQIFYGDSNEFLSNANLSNLYEIGFQNASY